MKKIWKFGINLVGGIQSVDAPVSFEILHFDVQGPQFFIWALVDPDTITAEHRFQIYGTGHEIDRDRKFLGSVLADEYVWHLFEVLE